MHACIWARTCVLSDINYMAHTRPDSHPLPSAYVIFSCPLWLKAVSVQDEADFGKHPADTLAPVCHDTELPPLR